MVTSRKNYRNAKSLLLHDQVGETLIWQKWNCILFEIACIYNNRYEFIFSLKFDSIRHDLLIQFTKYNGRLSSFNFPKTVNTLNISYYTYWRKDMFYFMKPSLLTEWQTIASCNAVTWMLIKFWIWWIVPCNLKIFESKIPRIYNIQLLYQYFKFLTA